VYKREGNVYLFMAEFNPVKAYCVQ